MIVRQYSHLNMCKPSNLVVRETICYLLGQAIMIGIQVDNASKICDLSTVTYMVQVVQGE